MAPKASLTQSDLFCTAEPDTGGAAEQEPGSHNLREKPPRSGKKAPSKGALPAITTASATGALERYLSDHEVAKRFEVSRATVWRWRSSNDHFPHSIQISPGTTRWALSELMAFEAHRRTSSNLRHRRPRGGLAQGDKL